MNWFEGLFYGIISGITEFLPISSRAHQRILQKLFGLSTADPLLDLFVHLALLAAVLIGCRNLVGQLRRGRHLQNINRRGIRGNRDILELRFLKNAVFPMILLYFILLKCVAPGDSLLWLAVFSLINAAILFFPSRMMQGNKDERSMSVFDSLLIGAAGALSVFPGISRISTMLSIATVRGVEKQKAINWSLLLSVPALLMLAVVDILNMFSAAGRTQITSNILAYILSAIGAYVAGYIGILLMRSLTANKDYSGFAFYALGVMSISLFLYLTVV